MRHRPVKSLDAKIAALSHLLLTPGQDTSYHPEQDTKSHSAQDTKSHPERREGSSTHPGRWYERETPRYAIPEEFRAAPVYVEFGCGKGDFINALSQSPEAQNTGALMVGIEGGGSIVLAALRKTAEAGISNVRYIKSYVNDATKAFTADSLDGIFLNFSDPWPKERHADRRLTSPSKAAAYFSVIKPGGFAVVKTDGKALYEYSLKTFSEAGFTIQYQTTNLEAIQTDVAETTQAAITAGNVANTDQGFTAVQNMALAGVWTQTEYERRFRGMGYPIYCFIAIRSACSLKG